MRIVLLFAVTMAITRFQEPFVALQSLGVSFALNVHTLIVFLGGAFVIYTALREIHHMLSVEEIAGDGAVGQRSVSSAVFWIVVMNLVFPFDSILSAVALANHLEDGRVVMALAIVTSGVLMIVLANRVSEFLKKNRLYEVLGLFILLIVGVMLVSEGGHLAHLQLFGYHVEPMAKSTFYFVILVLVVVVDVVQGRYQRKLLAQKHSKTGTLHAAA